MTNARQTFLVGVAALALSAVPAMASDLADVESDSFTHQMADNELDTNRGEGVGNITIVTSSNTATLNGNTVIGGVTGDNVISEGALQGANGLVTVIQNSGNNVIVNSATTATVQF